MNQDEIKEYIEKFLKNLTVSFDAVEIIEGEVHPIFHIKTSDSGVLIGNNGENLRALNYVIRKMVGRKNLSDSSDNNSEEEDSRKDNSKQFLVDVNGYHRRQIQELKNQAKILGERVRLFKSNVEMNPMNAYERMIIHSIFTGDSDIKTESEGEGKFRRVILKYQSEPVASVSEEF